MKKFFLVATLMAALSGSLFAQVDFSQLRLELGGNYSMYKGDFQQKTPGIKLRVSLPFSEKIAAGLGFTYGLPIKVPSSTSLSGGGSVPSEFTYNFKTFTLDAQYYFSEENEEGFAPYGIAGLGLVLVSASEALKGTVPAGEAALDLTQPASFNGFTINVGLGAQYSFGQPKVFFDAGIALPANKVENTFVSNPIPAHFIFNLGIRYSISGSGR